MDETIYVIFKVQFDFALEVWFSIYIFFIKLSIKTYLIGVCYDLNDTEGELQV